MRHCIFDIETAPLPETDISNLAPKFDAPANYKDPEKIAANIAEQKAAWLERGALSPLTGQVVAIGILWPNEKPFLLMHGDAGDEGINDESRIIRVFWDFYRAESEHSQFIGFNIFRFDLPFLIRRSWKLGLRVPIGVRLHRYFSDSFIDLMEVWQVGNREERISLDQLAKYLGVGAKTGSGADFYKLPPDLQRQYLTHDLTLTQKCSNVLLPTGNTI